MSITMSEYFSVSRSMQNANTAKYYFDGSILFCKIISRCFFLKNYIVHVFFLVYLVKYILASQTVFWCFFGLWGAWQTSDWLFSRGSFEPLLLLIPSVKLHINVYWLPTASNKKWDLLREKAGRVFIPNPSQNSSPRVAEPFCSAAAFSSKKLCFLWFYFCLLLP